MLEVKVRSLKAPLSEKKPDVASPQADERVQWIYFHEKIMAKTVQKMGK